MFSLVRHFKEDKTTRCSEISREGQASMGTDGSEESKAGTALPTGTRVSVLSVGF